jgi:hypothetical protein
VAPGLDNEPILNFILKDAGGLNSYFYIISTFLQSTLYEKNESVRKQEK